MNYALGTNLEQRQPWGIYIGGRALCPDGKVRRLHSIAQTADTFFSIPASVQVTANGKRKTVSGYVTVETKDGYSTATPDDPPVVKFFPVKTGKNYHLLSTEQETLSSNSPEIGTV